MERNVFLSGAHGKSARLRGESHTKDERPKRAMARGRKRFRKQEDTKKLQHEG